MWPAWVIYTIITVVSAGIAIALSPKPPKPKPASIEDFQIPTSEEGRPLPVIFGTVRVRGPNVLWYGDLWTVAIRESGGKK